MRRSLGQEAFSILETSIGMGVALMIMLASIQMLRLSGKEAKKVEVNNQFDQITQRVSSYLEDPDSCGGALQVGAPLSTTEQTLNILDPSGAPYLRDGQSFNSNLNVSSLKIRLADANPISETTVNGNLQRRFLGQIDLQMSRAVANQGIAGMPNRKTFYLNLVTDNTNTLSSCSAKYSPAEKACDDMGGQIQTVGPNIRCVLDRLCFPDGPGPNYGIKCAPVEAIKYNFTACPYNRIGWDYGGFPNPADGIPSDPDPKYCEDEDETGEVYLTHLDDPMGLRQIWQPGTVTTSPPFDKVAFLRTFNATDVSTGYRCTVTVPDVGGGVNDGRYNLTCSKPAQDYNMGEWVGTVNDRVSDLIMFGSAEANAIVSYQLDTSGGPNDGKWQLLTRGLVRVVTRNCGQGPPAPGTYDYVVKGRLALGAGPPPLGCWGWGSAPLVRQWHYYRWEDRPASYVGGFTTPRPTPWPAP